MTPGRTARAAEPAGAHGFLGREGEFAIVRSYSWVIVFTRQSARHATRAPTCPRRSRYAPKLSTISPHQNGMGRDSIPGMDQHDIEAIVRRALDEDLPDITSEAIFEPGDRGQARFLVKSSGILAGLPFAEATFRAIERESGFEA